MVFWLVLKLEIHYRVMISCRILVSFRRCFLKIIFLLGMQGYCVYIHYKVS